MNPSQLIPKSFFFVFILLTAFLLPSLVNAETSDFSEVLQQLTSKKYNVKTAAIEKLSKSQAPEVPRLLKGLLNARVYYRKTDKKLFYMEKQEGGYQIEAVLSAEKSILPKKRGFKKVTINNKLRRLLRAAIAGSQLSSPDVEIRRKAVSELVKNLDTNNIAILKKYYTTESDEAIKKTMQYAIAVGELSADDEATVIGAIKSLQSNLEPAVRNKLQQIIDETKSDKIKSEAERSLNVINGKIDLFEKMETLYFGLSFGSVLALAGLGLAITFGVMGVINMAHGELIMIGAYTTYVIQQLMPDAIGASILVAIPAAFLVAGLVGIIMERTVIRHLYGRPLETLLATFGISLILQQAVRSIFSPLNRTVVTPDWMTGVMEINSVFSPTWNRLYIILFCLMVFVAIMLVMKKTALGLQVRAVSQNRTMARAMGVRSAWVDALTFGLGAGIAGVAGVALSLLTNVGPNLGQAYIVDSFMVVVFGGVGNLWGTLVAGMSLGVVNKILDPWAGAVLAKILVLVFIILFIQKRPQGLFPQRGRAAEN